MANIRWLDDVDGFIKDCALQHKNLAGDITEEEFKVIFDRITKAASEVALWDLVSRGEVLVQVENGKLMAMSAKDVVNIAMNQ